MELRFLCLLTNASGILSSIELFLLAFFLLVGTYILDSLIVRLRLQGLLKSFMFSLSNLHFYY